MNYSLSNAIMFAAGAIIGSVVTWKLIDNKYKQIADEEIASVKETYSKDFTPDKFEPKKFEPEAFAYDETVQDLGYTTEVKKEKTAYKPHIITPEEYGEKDGYDTESLTYYADGVLADDQDEPIEDVDNVVGYGFESNFGEYEDDSVFIRNDKLKIDYEILMDQRNYSDVVNKTHHPTEGK